MLDAPSRDDPGAAAAPPATRTAGGTPGLDARCLAHLLGWQLSLADVPARRVFARHVGEPMGLKPVEFSLLVLVAFNPGAAQKQLAQALSVPPPKLTILVDRLAERGHVERVRSRSDRRSQELHLTPSGRALALRAHEASLTMERELLRALSDAERGMLLELLHKVAGTRKSRA